MFIEEAHGKFHVVKNNLVYGSFFNQQEADFFLQELAKDQVKIGDLNRLLTIEQVRNGEVMKPLENTGEFKLVDTIPLQSFNL